MSPYKWIYYYLMRRLVYFFLIMHRSFKIVFQLIIISYMSNYNFIRFKHRKIQFKELFIIHFSKKFENQLCEENIIEMC